MAARKQGAKNYTYDLAFCADEEGPEFMLMRKADGGKYWEVLSTFDDATTAHEIKDGMNKASRLGLKALDKDAPLEPGQEVKHG